MNVTHLVIVNFGLIMEDNHIIGPQLIFSTIMWILSHTDGSYSSDSEWLPLPIQNRTSMLPCGSLVVVAVVSVGTMVT